MQKLLGFSKAYISSSKSFIKRSARLDCLEACDGEEAFSPLISVWAYSVHRLLNGEGPGRLSLGEKKREKYDEQKKFGEKKKIYLYI